MCKTSNRNGCWEGISDAIIDGKNGFLIKPNSPLKLEEAIIKIMDNKKLYKRLSSNSLNMISKKYEINVIGKKYKILINQLYDSLLIVIKLYNEKKFKYFNFCFKSMHQTVHFLF